MVKLIKERNEMPGGYAALLYQRTTQTNLTPIFYSCKTHGIDKNGTVYDKWLNKPLDELLTNTEFKGDKLILLPGYLFGSEFSTRSFYVSVGVLVAMAFKPTAVPIHKLILLDVMYEDGDRNNIHPSNLVWKYPEEGIFHPHDKNFYFIPGYSNYLISKNGDVFSLINGKFKEPSKLKRGDLYVSMVCESGTSRGVTIARLLALTFIPYSAAVRKLETNHLDLDFSNNDLYNLEWCTVEENQKHAAMALKRNLFNAKSEPCNQKDKSILEDTLNRINNKPIKSVESKDLYTDEIKLFKSMTECAHFYKVGLPTIYHHLNAGDKNSILKKRFILRKSNCEWPDTTKNDIDLGKSNLPRIVLVKDTRTGDITEYLQAQDFYRSFGFSKKVVTSALRKGIQRKINCFLFQYKDSLKEWVE